MPDPRLALGVFSLLVLLAAALFWPRRGLVVQLLRWSRAGQRVSMEDALKHLYKCERRGVAASMESLAGTLGIGLHHAARVLGQLRAAGLVENDEPLVLTADGQAYALRIIRTHRLWERYLADRTGVAPRDWHTSAEDEEHRLSDDDVERLAARLGHPRYDPHGDPIPTASGEIPAPTGIPLTRLEPGDEAEILHLEDEPPELYDRLVSAGLAPAMSVRLLGRRGGGLQLSVDGREVELDPLAAGNVTVQHRVAGEGDQLSGAATLEDLETGESAVVLGLAPACQGIQRRRLLDLGVVPGTRVTAELSSTAGDPVAYSIRGALIALRREQQRWIRVRPLRSEEAA